MDKEEQKMDPPQRTILRAKKILVERFTNASADCVLKGAGVGLRGAILSGVMLSACAVVAFGAPPQVVAPLAGGPARPEDTETRTLVLDIKPQPVGEALTDWAQQTGLQVIVPMGPQTDRLLAVRIKGRFTARSALEQVLANTELTYEFINARTVVIRERRLDETKLTQVPASKANAEPQAQDKKSSTASSSAMLFASQAFGEEVIVAGSHIRGTLSAGSRVQIIDENHIAATGFATVQDALRTIPSNLGGGPSEDFDDGISGNFNRGVGVNLRRLGAGATLVLVNGRRQPISGATGTYVDVSSIPVSAISRIEVLTDGASAVYGSDAIGGVVNIVLRDNYDGAETQVDYSLAGDPGERRLSQIFGRTWDDGNVLLGYQFYDREALPQSARAYSASEDKRPFGGDDFRLFMSNPGNILDPATGLPAYAIPAGQSGASLRPEDLLPGTINLQGVQENADLLPQQQMHSAYFNLRQRIGEKLTLHADGRFSRREIVNRVSTLPLILSVPASNPFFVDPFGGSPMVFVAYNFLDDFGPMTGKGNTTTFSATADATLRFARTWNTRLAATFGKEQLRWRAVNLIDLAALGAALADPNRATAFNPFGDGSHTNPATLEAIRMVQNERATSTLQDLTLTTDGELFDLPGGAAKLAVGVDYREESLDSRSTDFTRLDRSIVAGFAEVAVPLVGESNSLPGVRELELSFAGRYENYSDFGTTLNPRLGVSWAPFDGVRMRGNWGTSFKAPSLIDGYITPTSSSINIASLADPRSPTGQSTVLLRQGRNAQLENETAEVWNVGLDFLVPGEATPTLSLTYFDIDFRDRIAEGGPPGAYGNILLQEAQWAELIQRDPTQEQLDALCGSTEFIGNPTDCSATNIVAVVDVRRRNLGRVKVQGIDLSFARPISTASWGEFGLGLEASYVLRYQIAASEQAPLRDIVDTTGNALALRLRGSLSWQRDQWSANLFVNYTDDYTDDLSRPQRDIASWTTVDMQLAYQIPARARWLGDLELSISAVNAFDKDPPFNNSRTGYDRANADPIGRTISARITKWW